MRHLAEQFGLIPESWKQGADDLKWVGTAGAGVFASWKWLLRPLKYLVGAIVELVQGVQKIDGRLDGLEKAVSDLKADNTAAHKGMDARLSAIEQRPPGGPTP